MHKSRKKIIVLLMIVLCIPCVGVLAAQNGGSSQAGGNSGGGGGGLHASDGEVLNLTGDKAKWNLYVSINPDFQPKKKVEKFQNVKKVEKIKNWLNSTFANSSECTSSSCISEMKKILGEFGLDDDSNGDNCEKFNGHIYFAITAPIAIGGKGRYFNYLVKEIAQKCKDKKWSCGRLQTDRLGHYLYIYGRTSKKSNYYFSTLSKKEQKSSYSPSFKEIAKKKSGWGVFEVWIDKDQVCEPPIVVTPPPTPQDGCVRKQIRTKQNNPICSPTGQGTANVKEEVVGAAGTSTVYGNETYNYKEGSTYGLETYNFGSAYCSIFCTEEATVTLPKGFVNPVVLGGNIVWPTSNETKEAGRLNDKPLKLSGKKTCRIDVAPNSKQCSKLDVNYTNAANYVKKQASAKDWAKNTYEAVRQAISRSHGGNAEPSQCTAYYNSALAAAKTERRKQNVINSRINCEYYISKFNEVATITGEIAKCDRYTQVAAQNDIKNIYNFQVSGKVKNDDIEYNKDIDLEVETPVKYTTNFSCARGSNCWNSLGVKDKTQVKSINDFYSAAQIQNFISNIENRVITVSTNTSTYRLPKGLYNYIDKKTNKATTTKPESHPYTVVGYSNLPISLDAKKGLPIDVSLKDLQFGHTGKFKLNYTCAYEVTNSACVCPEGTLNAGQDLTCKLSEGSCIDVQEAYCDNDAYQEDLICPDEVDRYKCKNSNNVGGKMDITACVAARKRQGATLQQAIDYCDAVVCPLGIPIIYRVISLQNPFPGKDIANRVSGFNLTVTGRYPGANWDSVKLVNAQILNNRNVQADAVYNKEPLYVFDLDAKTVQKIRSYNKRSADGYADFNLNCVAGNGDDAGTRCISEFVHDSQYGLVDGVCQHATNKEAFDICAEK